MKGPELFKVNGCPQNQSMWDEAAIRLNCSVDERQRNTYHCVPNKDKTSLVEFCYSSLIGWFQSGNCVQVTSTGGLDHDNCQGILSGCPLKSYMTNKIFEYPECQHINTKDRCYTADPECSNATREKTDASTEIPLSESYTIESTTTTANITATIQDVGRDVEADNVGIVIGIVIGIVVFIALIVLITMCVWKYRKRNTPRTPDLEADQRIPLTSRDKIYNDSIRKVPPDVHLKEEVAVKLKNGISGKIPADIKLNGHRLKSSTWKKNVKPDDVETAETLSIDEKKYSEKRSGKDRMLEIHNVEESDEAFYQLEIQYEDGVVSSNWANFSIFKHVKGEVLSPSLEAMEGIECNTREEKSVLVLLLCMHEYCLDMNDFERLTNEMSEELKKKYGLHNMTKEKISDTCERLKDDYLNIDQNLVTFKSDNIKDRVVRLWFTMTNDAVQDLIENWCRDALLEYTRTCNYNQPQEKCIKIPLQYTTNYLKRMKEDILISPTIKDTKIHNEVCDILKIPKEILQLDSEARERHRNYLKLGTVPVYRARGMIVGCAGAGKTTFLNRLLGTSFEEIKKIKPTVGLEVFNNIFSVNEENESRFSLKSQGHDKGFVLMVPENKEKCKTLSLLDFGGQSAYYACHQIYLSWRAFYCLVVNMNMDMNAKVESAVPEQTRTVFQEWKYKDYFKFWLEAIHTYCAKRNKSPANSVRVIVIASHCDGKSEREINEFFDVLIACLPTDSELKQYLSRDYYFSLSFDYNGGVDHEIVKIEHAIIDTITKHGHWGEKIPAKWEIFEMFIEEKRKTNKIITINDLYSTKVGLPKKKDEIQDLLRFYHDTGYILHFNEDDLRNTIILDIQWFVDAFKNIITDKNNVENAASRNDQFLMFSKTGNLDEEVLVKLWEKFRDRSFNIHKDQILPYMQRLGLLVEFRTKERKTIYYIPSMNKTVLKKEDMEKMKAGQIKTSALTYKFEFLPCFVFYRLVVLCIEKYGLINNNTDEYFNHNVAFFICEGHTVGIAVTENYIQCQIFRQDVNEGDKKLFKIKTSAVLKIRSDIEEMLKKLTKTCQTNLTYTKGYMCNNGDLCENGDSGNFVKESEIKAKKKLQCPRHPFDHHLVSEKFVKYWT